MKRFPFYTFFPDISDWRHLLANGGDSISAVAIVRLSRCFRGCQCLLYQTLKSIFFYRQAVWTWNHTWWSLNSQNKENIKISLLFLYCLQIVLSGKVPPVVSTFRNVGKVQLRPWRGAAMNGLLFSLKGVGGTSKQSWVSVPAPLPYTHARILHRVCAEVVSLNLSWMIWS